MKQIRKGLIRILIWYFSASCCQTCLAREFLCRNLIGHFSHPNFFSSEWILRWTLMSVTCFRQTRHCHSVTPVWHFLSWLRHFCREKKCLAQPGSGQINIRSDLNRKRNSKHGLSRSIRLIHKGVNSVKAWNETPFSGTFCVLFRAPSQPDNTWKTQLRPESMWSDWVWLDYTRPVW